MLSIKLNISNKSSTKLKVCSFLLLIEMLFFLFNLGLLSLRKTINIAKTIKTKALSTTNKGLINNTR